MGTDRRDFLKRAAAALGGVSMSACGGGGGTDEPAAGAPAPAPAPTPAPPAPSPTPAPAPVPAPASPPPVSATATFTLVNGGSTLATHFCLGQAFRPGEMPDGVACPMLPAFQASVLNRWPDGSVRFAVLAGVTDLAAGASQTFDLVGGTATAGTAVPESVLAAAAPDAELGFSPIGSVRLADLVGTASRFDAGTGRYTPGRVRQLIAGSQMSAWVYYAPVGGHAHLAAWFEVRCWADGAVEVLPWIENGWWNVGGPTSHAGTLRYVSDGVERLSYPITLAHHCRAAAVGPDGQAWRTGATWLAHRHDVTYLQATGLVPTYAATASEAALARQAIAYAPLDRAGLPETMGSGGYSPSIGLLPEWDVAYLTGGADLRAYQSIIVNALASGRWPLHYRDERTNQVVSPADYPTRVLSTAGGIVGIASVGASSVLDTTPAASGVAPPTWAGSHHCSAGYMAYLVSGWHYFIEETQFVASACHYKMGDLPREGTRGIQRPDTAVTPRGVAWALRSIAQAAALTPAADALGGVYRGIVEANAEYNHAVYVAQPNNPFGLMAPYGDAYTPAARGTTLPGNDALAVRLSTAARGSEGVYVGWFLRIGGQSRTVVAYRGPERTAVVDQPFTVDTSNAAFELTDGQNRVPVWMEDFMTGVFGYQLSLKLALSPSAQSKLEAFFRWKARSVVGRFGRPGVATEYNYCDAAQYELAAAPTDTPDFIGGTGPWYANWGEIYQATVKQANVATPGDRLRGAYFPNATSYWGNLQPALAYAVEHGADGAANAYALMTSDPGWADFVRSAADHPVWSVRPAH